MGVKGSKPLLALLFITCMVLSACGPSSYTLGDTVRSKVDGQRMVVIGWLTRNPQDPLERYEAAWGAVVRYRQGIEIVTSYRQLTELEKCDPGCSPLLDHFSNGSKNDPSSAKGAGSPLPSPSPEAP
jgi:hypothetical protein